MIPRVTPGNPLSRHECLTITAHGWTCSCGASSEADTLDGRTTLRDAATDFAWHVADLVREEEQARANALAEKVLARVGPARGREMADWYRAAAERLLPDLLLPTVTLPADPPATGESPMAGDAVLTSNRWSAEQVTQSSQTAAGRIVTEKFWIVYPVPVGAYANPSDRIDRAIGKGRTRVAAISAALASD